MDVERAPPDWRSLEASVAVLPGPDAILAFNFGEGCVDRSRDGRGIRRRPR